MKKRLLSLLLALSLVFSMGSTAAWAAEQEEAASAPTVTETEEESAAEEMEPEEASEETEPAEEETPVAMEAASPIEVTVTICEPGAIAVGKNNTLMARVPVTVTDLNQDGQFTYDEAMVAAHETYYKDGKSGFEISDSGWVTKLWGQTEGVGGYYKNHASTNLAALETIQAGDDLVAFVYADASGWSDKYSFFDQDTVSVKTGESLTLTLQAQGYDSNWNVITAPVNNAELITVDNQGAFHERNVTTDETGKGTISFDEAGTYVVSAYSSEDILVPPVCVVTVTGESLSNQVTNAVSNCVTGYQAKEQSVTCQFGAEWVMLGRLRALDGTKGWTTKDTDIQTYVASVEQAIQNGKLSKETIPTTIERVILTLTALGLDATNFCGQDLTAWLYENQDWENYSVSDLMWGLIALDSGKYTASAGYREALIAHMLDYQTEAGGFFYSSAWPYEDVDMTAMAMIALAPYKDSNSTAKQMYNKGWAFIESKRDATTGSYGDSSNGSDPCCTNAYVVIALCAAGEKGEKLNKAVSWMLNNCLIENGFAFNGKYNGMSTYQGLLAMAAYQRAAAGKNNLFAMSDVTKRVIQVKQPKVSGSKTYTGKKQTAPLPTSEFYTISGTTSATKVGKYTVKVALNDKHNTTWADGSTDDLTLTWKITQAKNTITVKNVTKTTSTKTQTVKLGATVKGGAKLSYRSNSKYVKVDKNGKLTISKNFVGKATITITSASTSSYEKASKTVTVTVNPAGVKLTSVTNKSGKKMKVYWKKNTKVTGYQIQYSTSSKFKSAKTVTVKGYKYTSKTISKLTKKKKYYVRVRTYKTVSSAKYYSGWSGVKSVTIKK